MAKPIYLQDKERDLLLMILRHVSAESKAAYTSSEILRISARWLKSDVDLIAEKLVALGAAEPGTEKPKKPTPALKVLDA